MEELCGIEPNKNVNFSKAEGDQRLIYKEKERRKGRGEGRRGGGKGGGEAAEATKQSS